MCQNKCNTKNFYLKWEIFMPITVFTEDDILIDENGVYNVAEGYTEIADGAFLRHGTPREIQAANVKTVGQEAFNSCYELTIVDLPVVITIKEDAFAQCINLTNINLPEAETLE